MAANPTQHLPTLPPPRRRALRRVRFHPSRVTPLPLMLIVALLTILIWQILVWLALYPSFIIPAPLAVAAKFWEVLIDGTLLQHTLTTLVQMLAGLALGASAGVALGYGMAKSRALEQITAPIVLAFQSTPVVAYAPLLIVLFGNGITSKIVICALIVFFPLLMNTLVGVRSIPAEPRDLMRALGATRWQMARHLEMPAALPILLGGLKVSATLAVIGAVVGEFIGASAGLGFMINLARSQFDTPLVFVGVIMLTILARAMYGTISAIERRALRWRDRSEPSSVV